MLDIIIGALLATSIIGFSWLLYWTGYKRGFRDKAKTHNEEPKSELLDINGKDKKL